MRYRDIRTLYKELIFRTKIWEHKFGTYYVTIDSPEVFILYFLHEISAIMADRFKGHFAYTLLPKVFRDYLGGGGGGDVPNSVSRP